MMAKANFKAAPKLGLVCTAIGAFCDEAKKTSELQMRRLFDQLVKEGSISKDSIFEGRIFGYHEAQRVAERFSAARVDVVFLLNSAFPNGHVFATLASDPCLRTLPFIVGADSEIDMGSHEWTTNAWCGAVMNNFVAKRIGRRIRPLPGCPKDKRYGQELRRLLKVFQTVSLMRKDYLGRFGDAPGGFHSASGDQFAYLDKFGTKVDTVDLSAVLRTFEGGAFEGELGKEAFSEKDVKRVERDIRRWCAVKLNDGDLRKCARMYLAFRSIIRANGYTSAAIRCWPELMGGSARMAPCVIPSLLNAYHDVRAVGCESDWPMAVAQSIGALLSGAPSPCLDFVNVTSASEIVQLAHCGVGVFGRMARMGRSANSLACHSPCRQAGNMLPGAFVGQFEHGPKTGLSLLHEGGGRFKMLAFSGESSPETAKGVLCSAADVKVERHERLHELIFEHGFSHHLAMAFGDIRWELKELAGYYGIEFITP